jgi:hypothetical protein
MLPVKPLESTVIKNSLFPVVVPGTADVKESVNERVDTRVCASKEEQPFLNAVVDIYSTFLVNPIPGKIYEHVPFLL